MPPRVRSKEPCTHKELVRNGTFRLLKGERVLRFRCKHCGAEVHKYRDALQEMLAKVSIKARPEEVLLVCRFHLDGATGAEMERRTGRKGETVARWLKLCKGDEALWSLIRSRLKNERPKRQVALPKRPLASKKDASTSRISERIKAQVDNDDDAMDDFEYIVDYPATFLAEMSTPISPPQASGSPRFLAEISNFISQSDARLSEMEILVVREIRDPGKTSQVLAWMESRRGLKPGTEPPAAPVDLRIVAQALGMHPHVVVEVVKSAAVKLRAFMESQ